MGHGSVPEAVLGVFESVDGPVVTSGDVAEALDCSRDTARRKLRALQARGRVASRTTAGRVVWWLVAPRDPRGVDPDDPFREFEPGSSGEADVSERIRTGDRAVSFVDHTTAVLADERDVDHVFAFDDDFRTLGFTVVPADTGQ